MANEVSVRSTVTVSLKTILLGLILTVLLLSLVSVFFRLVGVLASGEYLADSLLRRITNVDEERSIATWFSSSLLLFAALLLGIIVLAVQKENGAFLNHWRFLAVTFLFFSLDETTSIHESSAERLRDALGARGLVYFAWIIPASVLVLIFVLAYRRFLMHVPLRLRRFLLISGAVYVAGAVGMEAVGGWYAYSFGQENLTYFTIVSIEETLEMAGLVVFVYALLEFIQSHVDAEIRLRR